MFRVCCFFSVSLFLHVYRFVSLCMFRCFAFGFSGSRQTHTRDALTQHQQFTFCSYIFIQISFEMKWRWYERTFANNPFVLIHKHTITIKHTHLYTRTTYHRFMTDWICRTPSGKHTNKLHIIYTLFRFVGCTKSTEMVFPFFWISFLLTTTNFHWSESIWIVWESCRNCVSKTKFAMVTEWNSIYVINESFSSASLLWLKMGCRRMFRFFRCVFVSLWSLDF